MPKSSFETAICFSANRGRPFGGALRAFRRVVSSAALGCAVVLFSAPVAQATGPQTAGHLTSVKPVAAPAGFSGVCDRYSWACARGSQDRISADRITALAATVNLRVNRSFRQVSDARQYNRREYWALPTALGGDCEDFALMKKRELIRAGVAPDRLRIATVLDRQRNAHAVLVLRTDAGDVVLDNLTNRIVGWDETGYTFLRIQDPSAPGGWSMVMAGGLFAELSRQRAGA